MSADTKFTEEQEAALVALNAANDAHVTAGAAVNADPRDAGLLAKWEETSAASKAASARFESAMGWK